MRSASVRPTIKVLLAVSYVLMIAINGLANALPINGRTTGAVSDSYPNLFAPAGVTFAIWGVIYLLLGAHVLYQLGLFRGSSGEQGNARGVTGLSPATLDRSGVLFAASSLVNGAWILAWHYDFIGLSTILLITMLVLLIGITRTVVGSDLSRRESFFVRLPFSVYFGWLTVATIANTTVWLVSIRWNRFGIAEVVWAVSIIVVGAVIGSAVILRDRDLAYGLVFVWAYLGIWIKHTSPSGFAGAYPAVIGAALAGIAAFVVVGGLTVLRSRSMSNQLGRRSSGETA